MAEHPAPEWISPGFWGAVGASVAGLLAYLGVRLNVKKNPAVDPQDAVNEGFIGVLGEMRQELKAASRERNALRIALAQERLEREKERAEFLGQIAQLQQVARSFEDLLRRSIAGEKITLPERRPHAPVEPEVVQATLRQEGLPDA